MATISIAQARYLGNRNGHAAILEGGPERPNIKETASQTYAQGAPAYKDSNGTIAVAVASSNIIGELAGFAQTAATGTTGAEVTYRPVRQGDRYLMNINGTSTTTTALTQQGNKYMLDLYTGNLVVVNPDASFDDTKPWVRVLDLYTVVGGFADGDVVGDTNGRVIVEFGGGSGVQG